MKTEYSSECRLLEQIPQFAWFLVQLNPAIWGIVISIENRVFLRLKVIRENSPFCRIFVKWNPTILGIRVSLWQKNQYNQNMEQFLSWFIGPWSQTLIFQNSSFCSFFYISYPTIWGIWNWFEFWISLRLKENKEIPHSVGFLAHWNPTIWGIWN